MPAARDTAAMDKPMIHYRLMMLCACKNTGVNFIGPDRHFFFKENNLVFLVFLQENICCGYSLEVPHRGTSNEYP